MEGTWFCEKRNKTQKSLGQRGIRHVEGPVTVCNSHASLACDPGLPRPCRGPISLLLQHVAGTPSPGGIVRGARTINTQFLVYSRRSEAVGPQFNTATLEPFMLSSSPGSLCTHWGHGLEVSDLLCRCKMTLGGSTRPERVPPR